MIPQKSPLNPEPYAPFFYSDKKISDFSRVAPIKYIPDESNSNKIHLKTCFYFPTLINAR